VLAGGIKPPASAPPFTLPRTRGREWLWDRAMPVLTLFSPKPEPLVGPTGREALVCLGSAGLHGSIVRAEDPLEVGIDAHDDVVSDIGIGDGSVAEDKRASPRMPLLPRRGSLARALDQLVLGLGIADHLVLLPVGGGRGSSAGYARAELRPCLPDI